MDLVFPCVYISKSLNRNTFFKRLHFHIKKKKITKFLIHIIFLPVVALHGPFTLECMDIYFRNKPTMMYTKTFHDFCYTL